MEICVLFFFWLQKKLWTNSIGRQWKTKWKQINKCKTNEQASETTRTHREKKEDRHKAIIRQINDVIDTRVYYVTVLCSISIIWCVIATIPYLHYVRCVCVCVRMYRRIRIMWTHINLFSLSFLLFSSPHIN